MLHLRRIPVACAEALARGHCHHQRSWIQRWNRLAKPVGGQERSVHSHTSTRSNQTISEEPRPNSKITKEDDKLFKKVRKRFPPPNKTTCKVFLVVHIQIHLTVDQQDRMFFDWYSAMMGLGVGCMVSTVTYIYFRWRQHEKGEFFDSMRPNNH